MPSYWRHLDAIGISSLRRELPWNQERFDINWREEHRQKSLCPATGTSGYKYVLYQINQLHITSYFARRVCDLPGKICCSLRLYSRNIISIKKFKKEVFSGPQNDFHLPYVRKERNPPNLPQSWEDGNTQMQVWRMGTVCPLLQAGSLSWSHWLFAGDAALPGYGNISGWALPRSMRLALSQR